MRWSIPFTAAVTGNVGSSSMFSEPDELKEPRAQRIVEPDEGTNVDDEKDLVAELVDDGDDDISAEEAAIHIEEEP